MSYLNRNPPKILGLETQMAASIFSLKIDLDFGDFLPVFKILYYYRYRLKM